MFFFNLTYRVNNHYMRLLTIISFCFISISDKFSYLYMVAKKMYYLKNLEFNNYGKKIQENFVVRI